MKTIHPKVLAAFFGALAVLIVTVGNSIVDAYPNEAWVPLLAAIVPVIAGYLKSAE